MDGSDWGSRGSLSIGAALTVIARSGSLTFIYLFIPLSHLFPLFVSFCGFVFLPSLAKGPPVHSCPLSFARSREKSNAGMHCSRFPPRRSTPLVADRAIHTTGKRINLFDQPQIYFRELPANIESARLFEQE